MDYGVGMRAFAPPVAPYGGIGRAGGKRVEGGELWKIYYGEYARYTRQRKEDLDVWRAAAASLCESGSVGCAGASLLLGCCRGVVVRDCCVERRDDSVEVCGSAVGGCRELVSRGVVGMVDYEVRSKEGDETSEARVVGLGAVGGSGVEVSRDSGEVGHADRLGDPDVRSGVAGDGHVDVELKEKGESDEAGSGKYVPPHVRARGKHYVSNKAAKERRKVKKLREQEVSDGSLGRGSSFATCTVEQRSQLQHSRALRLVAENELKTAEAVRKLELLQAQDVNQLKKRQETKLMRDTELNKVQVEQAFGKLAGTGNVPGFARTVVSSEGTSQLVGGSISPNSSASMAEVHAMQKENLEYRRRMEVLMKESPDLYAKVLAAKLPSEETGWSIDENGWPKGHIGDGVGGMIGPDGRLHDYDDYADY